MGRSLGLPSTGIGASLVLDKGLGSSLHVPKSKADFRECKSSTWGLSLKTFSHTSDSDWILMCPVESLQGLSLLRTTALRAAHP